MGQVLKCLHSRVQRVHWSLIQTAHGKGIVSPYTMSHEMNAPGMAKDGLIISERELVDMLSEFRECNTN